MLGITYPPDANPPTDEDESRPSAVGCSAGSSGASGAWSFAGLALLLMLLISRRRREATLAPKHTRSLGLLAALLLVCCREGGVSGDSADLTLPPDMSTVQPSAEGPSVARLVDVEILTERTYVDAVISPDGAHVALSHPGFDGLDVAHLASGGIDTLRAHRPRRGWRPSGRSTARSSASEGRSRARPRFRSRP